MFRQSLRAIARVNRAAGVRTYAEAKAAPAEGLKLSFALPHETLIQDKVVSQVNIPAVTGDMGVLANHVPTMEQLKPGIVEIFETAGSKGEKYFINGGFASVLPDSKIDILSIEAFTLDSFDKALVTKNLAEAKKNVDSADEKVAAEAAIQVETLEALQQALA